MRPPRLLARGLPALALAALAACNTPVPPPEPILADAALVFGGQPFDFGWVGQAATLRVTGQHLVRPGAAGGAARFAVVRTERADGGPAEAPALTFAVPVVRQGEREEATLPLPATAMETGRWTVSLLDAAGLPLLTLPRAFQVLPPPVVTGVDRPALCQAPPGRRVLLQGTDLPAGADPAVSVALVEAGGERQLQTGAWHGCPLFSSRLMLCTGLEVILPSEPAAGGGTLELRVGGAEARLPGQPLSAAVAYGAPSASGWAGRLFVADAAQEVQVWGRAPVLVGPGHALEGRLDGAPAPLRADECGPASAAGVSLCQALHATVPQGLAPGSHAFQVVSEAGCTTTTSLEVAPRPVLSAIEPAFVCQRVGPPLRLAGEGLEQTTPLYSAGGTGPWTFLNTIYTHTLPIGEHLVVVEGQATPAPRSAPLPLAVYPGPLLVSEVPAPRYLLSTSRRPVRVWASAFHGRLTARLVPTDGGSPLPVPLSPADGRWELEFPALGGDRAYHVELSDESPCGSRSTIHPLGTRSDPVLLTWDFDAEGLAPYAYDANVSRLLALQPALTPGAGVTGAAATASADADLGDWSLAWFHDLGLGDPGLLRFDLKATGTGAPASARRLRLQVVDANLRHLDLFHELPAPVPGAWTRYELRLDDPTGWTTRHATGPERPSVIEDFQSSLRSVFLPAGWWAGPVEVAVDDLVIELAR